jgi:hypothetical protein
LAVGAYSSDLICRLQFVERVPDDEATTAQLSGPLHAAACSDANTGHRAAPEEQDIELPSVIPEHNAV